MNVFYKTLNTISEYNFIFSTKEFSLSGHKLFIENKFQLNKEKILESINYCFNSGRKISSFDEIVPQKLFKVLFSQRSPKIDNYQTFKDKIYEMISKENNIKYRILYKGEKDFYQVSPGIRTSIILDLILGYDKDNAPLIIDQPEDNLSTNYISKDLVSLLKSAKHRRQIIIATHNATIPMLGDAQKVIICNNDENHIKIVSYKLEESYKESSITDWTAKLTDGGKPSIKKRVKKYNLKSFKGEEQ